MSFQTLLTVVAEARQQVTHDADWLLVCLFTLVGNFYVCGSSYSGVLAAFLVLDLRVGRK
jgi:hypothetical protein